MVVWVAGKKLCDPVNTCHSVALRDCLGRKNALISTSYFTTFTLLHRSSNFSAMSDTTKTTMVTERRKNMEWKKEIKHYKILLKTSWVDYSGRRLRVWEGE